jgi:hypothetical protein
MQPQLTNRAVFDQQNVHARAGKNMTQASRSRLQLHLTLIGSCLAALVALMATAPSALAKAIDKVKLHNGDIVVAGESALHAYLPNGKRDRRFGDSGTAKPFAPTGRRVAIEGIAVDRKGRIVLVGDAGHTPSTANAGDATSYAAVERFLSNGRLDPKFGSNGAVITDFGLPLPARPANIPDYAQISLPVEVLASGVAVDSRGRIVVTGTRAATYLATKTGDLAPVREAFVARLTSRGNQDPAFNVTGTVTLPGLTSISKPRLDRRNGVYFTATKEAPSEFSEGPLPVVVGHLTARGILVGGR